MSGAPSAGQLLAGALDEDLLSSAPPQASDFSTDDITIALDRGEAGFWHQAGNEHTIASTSTHVLNAQSHLDEAQVPQVKRVDSDHVALTRERDWLRNTNEMLEKAANDFEQLREKFERVTSTSTTSHNLLDVYSRILAQAEHTQTLLRDRSWLGLEMDREMATRQASLEHVHPVNLQKSSSSTMTPLETTTSSAIHSVELTHPARTKTTTNTNTSKPTSEKTASLRGRGRGQARASSIPQSRIGRVLGRGRRP